MLFLISSKLLDSLNVFGDHFTVSGILAFNLSTFIDLATFEFVFLDSNFELFGFSIELFHFFVEIITRWLPQEIFGKLWNLSID